MLPHVAKFLSRILLAAALVMTLSVTVHAQVGSERYASIVVDAASGNILSSVNADERRFPASLTKMMTLYMLFEAIRDRRVTLDQYVPVSSVAASMPPTKLGLVPGSLITVEQGILGLVTKSANDAASALGELLGGDEDRFAQMMTLRARALGMTNTQFRNASGLPDWDQFTSARDLAVLARHLIQDFPGFYHYFSTPSFRYAGRFVPNHQRLLQTYPGADGIKTGYIEASGYNVVTSAVRGDTRLIGVVMGANSGGERDQHMTLLLDMGFERMGVAPAFVARREPPRFGLFTAAHAAALPPRVVIPAPPPPLRARAAARSWAPAPAMTRRSPTVSRAERLPVGERFVRPAPAVGPTVRPGTTRTAHQVPGRYPG